MYKIIPEDEQREYTFLQLKNKFDGKWVYLVHAQFTNARGLIKEGSELNG